ncbi:hypothetical protein D3C71_897370 [compost metagenome]
MAAQRPRHGCLCRVDASANRNINRLIGHVHHTVFYLKFDRQPRILGPQKVQLGNQDIFSEQLADTDAHRAANVQRTPTKSVSQLGIFAQNPPRVLQEHFALFRERQAVGGAVGQTQAAGRLDAGHAARDVACSHVALACHG